MIALYPIKPKYINKILEGEKTFELRRRLPKSKLKYVLLYSTSPVGKVVGFACVAGTRSEPVSRFWDELSDFFGISKENYFEYFDGCELAKAIEFSEVFKFKRPFSLTEIKASLVVPQSFCYIDKSDFKRLRRRKCLKV